MRKLPMRHGNCDHQTSRSEFTGGEPQLILGEVSPYIGVWTVGCLLYVLHGQCRMSVGARQDPQCFFLVGASFTRMIKRTSQL